MDALTYGLSTLCLGSRFSQRPRWVRGGALANVPPSQRLVDNQYAKYTRKFSLGNGPADWVSEYVIAKESGKMLGTLVALAVAKMVNLEVSIGNQNCSFEAFIHGHDLHIYTYTYIHIYVLCVYTSPSLGYEESLLTLFRAMQTFIWDMPTGVLSDIFMSLASLQDHYPNGEPKLEQVWIRWHDNAYMRGASTPLSSPASPTANSSVIPEDSVLTPVGNAISHGLDPLRQSAISYSESRVEYPTFSVLPPLKSLTVLDIDELAYLDEMSLLIERSKASLRELRVGLSTKVSNSEFAQAWDGRMLHQVDHDARWPGESQIGDRRLGGVLGVLVGRVYDIRQKFTSKLGKREPAVSTASDPSSGADNNAAPPESPSDHQSVGLLASAAHGRVGAVDSSESCLLTSPSTRQRDQHSRPRLNGKLMLETLELERVPLSITILSNALDWSMLTSLTLLDCLYHEQLWKVLKRQFQPTVSTDGAQPQYHMSLKHIHTNTTSLSLINFIKETLRPNTLEVLFLLDSSGIRAGATLPSVGQIFKGILRRHRSSLKKLLLDSSDTAAQSTTGSEYHAWHRWELGSDEVAYLTSGRMKSLKELTVTIHCKDWVRITCSEADVLPFGLFTDRWALTISTIAQFPPGTSTHTAVAGSLHPAHDLHDRGRCRA